jgi:YHS domain-containing protein
MRILFYLLLIFLALYLILSLFFKSNENSNSHDAETEMVRDPNCHTYIQKSNAIRRFIKGDYHYFCSSRCKKEYKNKINS